MTHSHLSRAQALIALITLHPSLALALGKTLQAGGFVPVGRGGTVWIHPRDTSMLLVDGTKLVPFSLDEIDHALQREARSACVAWWCKGTQLKVLE